MRLRWWRALSRFNFTMNIFDSLRKKSGAAQPNEAGLFVFRRQTANEQSRIHLRVDPDGSGLLLVNANRVMHLNPSAALMARLALSKVTKKQAIKTLQKQFAVAPERIITDYQQFCEQLEELVRPDAACPIHDLQLETIPPFSSAPSAPYRMDLALTYRCNNSCSHCYNARPRNFPELETEDWKRIIDRVWDLGIPHVVFTGGEPTLRTDLIELITFSEQKGMVTGLNTNGRCLKDPKFVEQLVAAGLDHVQITLESHDEQIHNQMVQAKGAWTDTVAGIQRVLETPLYVMTNTTMLCENAPSIQLTLEFLSELGVPTIGLNALIHAGAGATCGSGLKEAELKPILSMARGHCDAHSQKLIWYTPTQYCHFDPMELALGVKGCTAALYNMCIEPDGAVLPCQSFYKPLGNLLSDPWSNIWEHDLSIGLRKRHYKPAKCSACELLSECGGGCPLSNSDLIFQPMQQTNLM